MVQLVAGRGGGIRTPGPLLPKQMRYQAALRPDFLHPNATRGRYPALAGDFETFITATGTTSAPSRNMHAAQQ